MAGIDSYAVNRCFLWDSPFFASVALLYSRRTRGGLIRAYEDTFVG